MAQTYQLNKFLEKARFFQSCITRVLKFTFLYVSFLWSQWVSLKDKASFFFTLLWIIGAGLSVRWFIKTTWFLKFMITWVCNSCPHLYFICISVFIFHMNSFMYYSCSSFIFHTSYAFSVSIASFPCVSFCKIFIKLTFRMNITTRIVNVRSMIIDIFAARLFIMLFSLCLWNSC